MKCKRCGKETPNNIQNCIHCGYVFDKNTNVSKSSEGDTSKKNEVLEVQKKLIVQRRAKQKKQNLIAIIIVLVVLIVVSVTIGIGVLFLNSKNSSNNGIYATSASVSLSRAEWIEKLSEHYGMENCVEQNPFFEDVNSNDDCFIAIQYCTEWGIIDKESSNFEPAEACTNTFAVVTAVKSVGLDLINSTEEGKNVSTESEIISYFNLMSGVSINTESYLDENTSEQILIGLDTIRNNLVFENSTEIKLKDNVKRIDINDILKDTGKVITLNSISIKVDDILLIEACEEYPSGRAVKVTNISNKNIEYKEAEISDTFEELDVIGNFAPELLGVGIDSDDYEVEIITNPEEMKFNNENDIVVSYLGSPDTYNNSPVDFNRNVNVGDVWINLKSKLDKNLSLNGKLCLANCTINLQIKTDNKGIQKVSVSLRSTAKLQISLSAKKDINVPTIKMPFKIFGIVGGEIDVNIKVGISGTATFSLSCDCELGCSYKRGCMPKYPKPISNPKADSDLKVSGSVKAETVLFAALINKDLFDVGFETGFVGDGKTNDYGCMDLEFYWIFEAFVNSDKSMLADLGIRMAWTVFDKDNTPLKWNWHIENGQVFDRCTKTDDRISENNSKATTAVDDYSFNSKDFESTSIGKMLLKEKWSDFSEVVRTFGENIYSFTFDKNGDINVRLDSYQEENYKGKIVSYTDNTAKIKIYYDSDMIWDISIIEGSQMLKFKDSKGAEGLMIETRKLYSENERESSVMQDLLFGTSWVSKTITEAYPASVITFYDEVYDGYDFCGVVGINHGSLDMKGYVSTSQICNININDGKFIVLLEKTNDDDVLNAFVQEYDGEIICEKWYRQ